MAGNVAADLVVHVGADIADAQKGLDTVGNSVNNTGKGFKAAGAMMAGGALAVVGGLGASVMAAANFEQAMAEVDAVADLTGQQFDALSDLALNIGNATSFGASEGAAAIGELVKAGVPVQDILDGAAMSAAQLAEAGGVAIPQAAEIMSNSMNMFSLSGTDAAMVADTFAAAANASAADVAGLSAGLAQGGPAAASFGMSLQDTVASLALFSNYGIQGSDAGTSLKTMLQRLAAPTDEAAALMGELGISAFDAQGNFVGMEALAGQLNTAFKDMSAEQKNAALSILFGADASRVAGILAAEGAEGFSEMSDAVNDSGAAARMSEKRMNTLKGSIERIRGSIETAMIIIGSSFVPVLTMVGKGMESLLGWFLDLPSGIQKAVAVVAAITAAFLLAGAAVVFLGPALGAVAAAAIGLVGPFIGIGVAIGGIIAVGTAVALLFRDEIATAFDTVKGFVDSLILPMKMLWQYLTMVSDGSGRGAMALALLPEAIQPAVRQVGRLADVLEVLYKSFQRGGLSGLLDALPGQLSRAADAFGRLGEIIWEAVSGLDWAGIGTALWNGFTTAIGYIGDVAGAILGKIGNLTLRLGAWLLEQASAVPWGTILSYAAGKAGDITGQIVDKLGDLTGRISSWLAEKAGAVDWAGILSTAAGKAGDIVSVIVSKIGDLGTGLLNWYNNAIDSVPWNSLGQRAGELVGDVTRALAPKAAELIQGVSDWLLQNWQTIGFVLLGLFLGLPGLIGYIGTTLAPKALEFIQGFITGLNINWPAVTAWLSTVPSLLLGAIGSLAATLAPKAVELVQGLVTGLNQNWPMVTAWLGLIGSLALSAIGSLAATLIPKGVELLTGIWSGLNQHWPTIVAWLGLVGSLALAAIGSLATTLVSKGVELLTGIWTGLNQHWPTIVAWLGLVGSLALSAIGSLIATLVPKGVELIEGIVTGFNQHFPTVVSWLGQVGALALAAIGSLIATLLPKGVELIEGVLTGLNQHWPTVVSWLGLVGSLALSAIGSLASTLVSKGVELVTGILTGVVQRWPAVRTWLSDRGPQAFQAVGSLISTLLSRGVELITGILTGLNNTWPTVRAWLSLVGSLALAAVGNLASTLLSRGVELIRGILSGLNATWPTVSSWLSLVGSLAVSAVGDLGSTLWNAGWSLIQGLANGISAAAQSVYNTVSGIISTVTGMLSDIPGFSPIEHVGLYFGGKLGYSFAEGIAKAIPDVAKATEGLRSTAVLELPDSRQRQQKISVATDMNRNQPTVIYQTNQFDIHVDDLEDVVEAARFVRDIDTSRTLYFEGA